jgi:GlpG protein
VVVAKLGKTSLLTTVEKDANIDHHFNFPAGDSLKQQSLLIQVEQPGFFFNQCIGQYTFAISHETLDSLQSLSGAKIWYKLKDRRGEELGDAAIEIAFTSKRSGSSSATDLLLTFPISIGKHKLVLDVDAPLVTVFAILCFCIHAIDTLIYPKFTISLFSCWPWATFSVMNPLSYIRLFTHVLGHSSWGHLTGNLTMLTVVGPNCEEKYGPMALLRLIFVTAFTTGMWHVLTQPDDSALHGASGVVFMLVLLNSLSNFHYGRVPLSLVMTAGFWLSREVIDHVSDPTDRTSHSAHILGGLVGAVLGYVLNEHQSLDSWMHAITVDNKAKAS